MKYFYAIILFLVGCTSTTRSDIPPHNLKEFMTIFFHGHEYIYKDISSRGNELSGDKYALFEIKKDKLSKNEMNLVYKNLINNGWRIVGEKKNYQHFCYKDKVSLHILFPTSKYEETDKNVPIDFDSLDSWNVFYRQSSTKIADCIQNSENIIDFTKF